MNTGTVLKAKLVLLYNMCVCVFVVGSRILLKDTTLMPEIPGLPALVTMLFTPVMELRYVIF